MPRLKPLRQLAKKILYRPHGVDIGEGSYIYRPHRILSPGSIKMGCNSKINPHSYILSLVKYGSYQYSPEIIIGNDVYIGRYLYLVAIDSIRIEDGCVLSEYVYITDNFHGLHPDRGPIMEQQLESKGPVHIGKSCFLGFRVVIMPGVTLGTHCIVGANSVVTRSFPAYSMIAGVPAKRIKQFKPDVGEWATVKE